MSACEHKEHHANVSVFFLEDIGRWIAEVSIHCAQCDIPFEFQGVQPGYMLNVPSISIDAQTLNVPICPHGEKPTPLDLIGFQIKGLQS